MQVPAPLQTRVTSGESAAAHWFGSQAVPAAANSQARAPSQADWLTKAPAQTFAPQIFSEPGKAQAPVPLQVPAQVPSLQSRRRSCPSGTLVQVPVWLGTLQAMQGPRHSFWQQTPSTQWAD